MKIEVRRVNKSIATVIGRKIFSKAVVIFEECV